MIGITVSSHECNEHEVSVSAIVFVWPGIAEPAMYGINPRYRFLMLRMMIGSGLVGLLYGPDGVMANGIGVGGPLGILSIQPSYQQTSAPTTVIAIIIPIVLTSSIYQREYRLGTLDTVQFSSGHNCASLHLQE